MLLDDLTGTLELLRERIQSHGDGLRESETRTRMALVDPLLRALGWDVSNPAVVTPEYRVSAGSADYALLHPTGKPAATVEAKKLGVSLPSHQMQMLNYANASGIDFAALTDGDHWELYDVFRRSELAERRMLDVSISRGPVHKVALELMLLWRSNLSAGEPVRAGQPIFESEPPPPARAEAEQDASRVAGWVSLSSYEESEYASFRYSPAEIRFWDGDVLSVGTWVEVFVVTVSQLHSEGKLGDTPVVGRTGRVYWVSTEPVHPSGKHFERAKRIPGTSLFAFTAGNAKTLRGRTRSLLRRHGPESAEVHLRVTPAGGG